MSFLHFKLILYGCIRSGADSSVSCASCFLPICHSSTALNTAVVAIGKSVRIYPFGIHSDGRMTFEAAAPLTNDIAGRWAAGNIGFTAASELFCGRSPTEFRPGSGMARAVFATVPARLDGADLSRVTASRFSDVGDGLWHTSDASSERGRAASRAAEGGAGRWP